MANMFATAKEAPSSPKGKGKKEKLKVAIKGLEDLATIKYAMDALKGLYETVDADVRNQVKAWFIKTGGESKSQPENPEGDEGNGRASLQLRKRSSRSVLTDTEIALAKEFGLPLETQTDVAETFIINPEYANDQALLEKVSKALAKVPGLPEDFILKQTGKTTTVFADNAITALFATGDMDKITAAIGMVGTFAVGPKVKDQLKAAARVSEILALATSAGDDTDD